MYLKSLAKIITKMWMGGLLLAALALSGCISATAPILTDAQAILGEQIEVRVVNVETVVTDKQGNRITGLRPSDFQLQVDGKSVPIEYFNEVRGGQAVAPGEDEKTSPVKGLPSLAPGSPVGTSYLLFIDNFFSVTPRRMNA